MSNYNQGELIKAFSELGSQLKNPSRELSAIIGSEKQFNAWFTPESVSRATFAIGNMLNAEALDCWFKRYKYPQSFQMKRIGLILAGNIPLVGFHDVLCVLATGNFALIKASSQDARLISYVLQLLAAIDNRFADRFAIVERLENFDALIATGSNNSSRYFEYYFGKVPHIIRKNRNSLAILTGDESAVQLEALGHDMFDYFGLGCRNVSKLLVPKGFNFNFFFEAIEVFQPVIDHHKYHNNYDYNKSIYLVNRDQHLDNGFLLLKEDHRIASPLAVIYYEFYDNLNAVRELLEKEKDQIQCIVSNLQFETGTQIVDFGKSQQPELSDYADGVDTMEFLNGL